MFSNLFLFFFHLIYFHFIWIVIFFFFPAALASGVWWGGPIRSVWGFPQAASQASVSSGRSRDLPIECRPFPPTSCSTPDQGQEPLYQVSRVNPSKGTNVLILSSCPLVISDLWCPFQLLMNSHVGFVSLHGSPLGHLGFFLSLQYSIHYPFTSSFQLTSWFLHSLPVVANLGTPAVVKLKIPS